MTMRLRSLSTTGWLWQDVQNGCIKLFKCTSLWTNAAKTKVMTCLLGKIQVARTEEEYAAQQTGNAAMMKRWRIDCKVSGISFAAESLQSHLETQHDIYRLFVLN
jgi:hypothetical protein